MEWEWGGEIAFLDGSLDENKDFLVLTFADGWIWLFPLFFFEKMEERENVAHSTRGDGITFSSRGRACRVLLYTR